MINTILIGVQKAGTSSLYNWIVQHPEVYGPEEMKDFHFFSNDKFYNQGIEYLAPYYNKVSDEKMIMKGAVNYIFFPFVVKRLYDYNPNLKFILILRNPIERAISSYNYFYKLGVENLSFEEAIKREQIGKLKTVKEKSDFAYIEHGFYHKQILEYLKYFKDKQLKILIYEEVMKDKQTAIQDIYSFLDVDNSFIPSFDYLNKTGKAKYRKINQFFFGKNKVKQFIRPILHLTPIKYRIMFGNRIREINKKETDSKDQITFPSELRDIYNEDIKELSKLIGKDLTKYWECS
jgi:hypothetical protein